MKFKILYIIALLTCIIYGCGVALYVPASTDAAEQDRLTSGRKLYVQHCGGCHNLYLPKKFSSEKWLHELDEMQERSKITDTDKNLIHHYLISEPVITKK